MHRRSLQPGGLGNALEIRYTVRCQLETSQTVLYRLPWQHQRARQISTANCPHKPLWPVLSSSFPQGEGQGCTV